MSVEAARAVADAILYEGYVLYPYRASAQKNRSRWQFGVVMPAEYVAVDGSESSTAQTEVVLEYAADTTVEVVLRFLQVQRRTVEADGSLEDTGRQRAPAGIVGHSVMTPWEEAVEQEFVVRTPIVALLAADWEGTVHVDGGEDTEPVDGSDGGRIVRRRHPIDANITLGAIPIEGPWRALRLRVSVDNRTQLHQVPGRREDALPGAMVATHMIISVGSAAFVSMVDPPEWARPAVEACVNVGCWPVLAGPAGGRDTILASPIILYDHPEIAPESPTDLFDATEIDEILTLRTLALTDEEKREARATDARAAAVIDRVESLDGQTLERLHGAIRYLRTVSASEPGSSPDREVPWWDPGADASVSPLTDTVEIGGTPVGRGSTVRLRPGARRADAQDMFLVGRLATVEAVLLDVDDRPYLAVTLADDPSADLQRSHGRFLYFTPDEVEAGEVTPQ